MKRVLNEDAMIDMNSITICVSDIRKDDSDLDCNALKDIFLENGATVDGSHTVIDDEPATLMTVSGMDRENVLDILRDFLADSETCQDAESYIIDDIDGDDADADDSIEHDYPTYDDVDADDSMEPDYPAYDDVDADDDFEDVEIPAYEDVEYDPEEDTLNDSDMTDDELLNEGNGDVLEDAKEELTQCLSRLGGKAIVNFNDEIVLDSEHNGDNLAIVAIDNDGRIKTVDGEILNAYDLKDADDIYTICDIVNDEIDAEASYSDYDDADDEDLPKFEKMKKGRHLDEKKKGCCPGTNNINEDIDTVLADIDAQALQESQKAASDKQKKLEIKTVKALADQKYSLHENVRYNGKSFKDMTLKELKSLYESVSESIEKMNQNTLNESVVDQKTLDAIANKQKLLEFLDEEITYRQTRNACLKQINEDGAEISDKELETLFGPAQGEDSSSSDEDSEDNSDDNDSDKDTKDDNKDNEDSNDENSEEVELSRIEITLKDEEAAKELKQACLDADIPEDAFELKNVEEEDDTFGEDEDSEDNSDNEESSEDNEESADEESNDDSSSANESYEYADYVKLLLEGEAADDTTSDDNADGQTSDDTTDDTTDNADENSDENSDEDEDDKQPKFVLTNTDYAAKLAKVLEDVYGISKEEFEEMIGGEIVSEEDKEDEENKEDKEESDEKSDDKSDDEDSKDEKNDEDDLDPSDLFKNL